GVELPIFGGDAGHYRKVRKELDNLGPACTAVTICDAGQGRNPISADPAMRQKALDHLKWAIDTTATLGGDNLCGPYHSAIGVFSGAGPTDDERKRSADVMRAAAEYAKPNKVTLAVEYLNRFECYLITTVAGAVELVKMVGHPNFRTMYDTFHANIEEKGITAAIEAVAPHLAHVHISENDRGVPGTGHVPWDETFRALKKVGYDGWMVIESFGRALPDLAAATKVWRDLFPTPESVYTNGLAMIKEKWRSM